MQEHPASTIPDRNQPQETTRAWIVVTRRMDVSVARSMGYARPLESKVNRHSDENDNDTRKSRRGTVDKQNREDCRGAYQVERGHDRISESTIRPLRERAQEAKPEHPSDGEDVEHERRRHYVIEQVAIEVAVGSGYWIVRSHQNQKRGPRALHHQGSTGNSGAIHTRGSPKEQT